MRMVAAAAFIGLLALLASLSGCASLNAEKRAPILGERVGVDGEKMHVLVQGPRDSAKPPVILIHGASVNLRDMKIALGDRLAEDRLVMMIDRPGRGYSDRPEKGYLLDKQARLIKEAADAVGVKNPVVVGQSLGGAVALSYALQFQDEMTGLVLLAPVSHEWPGGVAWYNHAATTPIVGFFFRRLIIPAYGAIVAKDSVEESFAPDEPPNNYYERAGIALLFRASDFKANASDLVNLKRQIIGQQTRYGELRLPVAIAHGLSDDTVYPDIHSKALAEQIDGAALSLLPKTGHALHHAETQAVLALIESFAQ